MKRLFIMLALVVPMFALAEEVRFNEGWQFRIAQSADENYSAKEVDSRGWERVSLPHTPKTVALYTDTIWRGNCWYRNTLDFNRVEGEQVWLNIEAAMNVADVWVNGEHCAHHLGGYLPVVVDMTKYLHEGKNAIAIRLNNEYNTVTGPRPPHRLDFLMYGGLYRNVSLIVKRGVAITNPMLDTTPAAGGVFVSYDNVSTVSADVNVQVSVENYLKKRVKVEVVNDLIYNGEKVASASATQRLNGGKKAITKSKIVVENPRLWSHKNPLRYTLRTTVKANGKVVDMEERKIGIRSIVVKNDELYINGKKCFLRGVNRHQCYPYVGYAVSDNEQRRDAVRIKEAGFDFVRLSHYPQSEAFLDACDSLGICVLNCVFGWQYFNAKDPKFREFCYQQTRDMVRRDRNRPSIVAWEASLNETKQPADFIAEMSRLVHEEYPAPYCYSAGWQRGYDIYVESRQFRIFNNCKEYGVPLIVSEYGDYEYFANDGGLTQYIRGWRQKPELTSRQLREDGEVRMVQQVKNLNEAHIDNHKSVKAMGDGYWVMFDYNRGSSNLIEASGVMSHDRLPKYAYYYYRSLREEGKPMVFVASNIDENSPAEKAVISNCERVEIVADGVKVDELHYDIKAVPMRTLGFTKAIPASCKSVVAIGYRDGKEVARHEVCAPLAADKIILRHDDLGVKVTNSDHLLVHAYLADKNNTTLNFTGGKVLLSVEGAGVIEGESAVEFKAGIATFVVRTAPQSNKIVLTATSGEFSDKMTIEF